jgi:hypothetical protein
MLMEDKGNLPRRRKGQGIERMMKRVANLSKVGNPEIKVQ